MNTDWRSLFPYEAREFARGGVAMRYVDEGPGHAPPILCVHGNPTWSFYWRRVIERFSDSHRVIAVDHVGCGRSDKPADYDYSLAQRIDDLAALVEHLDLRDATLLVHDWGGPIGLGAALRNPQRWTRLALTNTAAFPPPYVPFRIRILRTPLLGAWAMRGLNAFAGPAVWMAVEKTLPPEVAAGLLAPYDSWAARVAIDGFVRDIPLTKAHPTWDVLAGIERDLPTLADRPVQIHWGVRDWCFRVECLERLAELLPGADVHRYDDAGHYVMEDAAEQILAGLDELLQRGAESDAPAPAEERSS